MEDPKKELAEEHRHAGQLFYLGGWVQSELKDIRQEIRDVRLETKQEIGTIRQEIGTLRQEMRQEFGALRQEMKDEFGTLREEVREGNNALHRRLDSLRRWVVAALFAMLLSVIGSLFIR